MNANLAKCLFNSGVNRRNPSLWNEYKQLKNSEWFTRNQLEQLQLEKAKSFLIFVEKYSPYYKEVFERCGFSATAFDSINKLKLIPTISKRELIGQNKAIHTDYPFNKIFIAETSGTTGSALEFRKNERWDSINRASMMRSYDWYDVNPWDRHGYFWGYNTAPSHAIKVQFLDMLQNRFRIFNYNRKSVEKFALNLVSAKYVAGYSSMIYEVAKIVNELNIEIPPLHLVKGTSEMILDVYQAESFKAFGRKITSEYGAAESGLIAFECPEGNMHINLENVIVEIDDDGGIIVTNIASYSYPVIRYKLGDVVTLSAEECICGRAHPIIKDIIGRQGSSVYGVSCTYPALTFYYVFKNIAIHKAVLLNYKAIQRDRGFVDLYVEGTTNKKHEAILMAELIKYFAEDMIFNIRYVDVFDKERKKSQYFESLVEHE
ncbi:phenylacetate--CoA ligase family protein [Desulforhopalus sp. 52FAK]